MSNVDVEDRGDRVAVTVTRDDYFLVRSLIAEVLLQADVRDFQTRNGVTIEEVEELLRSLPDIGA